MAANDSVVKKNGLSSRQAFVVAIVSAFLGSAGGPVLLSNVFDWNPYRSDPFTGTEGKLLERRLASLERHTNNHPDQTLQFDRRIVALEVRLQVIIDNQQRIIEKLDKI